MRKFLKLFVILVVSLMVIVACSNDDASIGSNKSENGESTGEIYQTKDDGANEDSDQEDVEDDNSDLSNSETDGEVPVLEFGETGVIEDTLGTYEVTPKSFRITDSLGKGSEDEIPRYNDVLVVVEIDVKNIGSETLDLEDITKADLYSNTGAGETGFSNYPEIIQFKGEIKPEESFLGHIVFDVARREYYELAFGANMPSHISNEIRWVLPMEDAE